MKFIDLVWFAFLLYGSVKAYRFVSKFLPKRSDFKQTLATRFQDLDIDRHTWERFYSLALGADISSQELMSRMIEAFVDGKALDIRGERKK